jgi:hypothetical protein
MLFKFLPSSFHLDPTAGLKKLPALFDSPGEETIVWLAVDG